MVSVSRGEDQKPPASAVSLAQPAPGGRAGAGFDIFTSTSCFLLSSQPALGNGSSFSPCFSSRISAGRGLCATSQPGRRRRAGTSSCSDRRAGGCGGRRGSCGRKEFSGSLAKNKSPAPGVTGNCELPGSRCYSQKDTYGARAGMAGRGWWHPSLERGQPPSGSGEVEGGLSVPPGYCRLHPLPGPSLPPPGISQLIPLAASLRHLEGLKTATVPAPVPRAPSNTGPSSPGHWHCPGAGWAPWPPPRVGPCSRRVVGVISGSPHPLPALGQWGQMWGDPPASPPPCLPAWGGGDGGH